MKEEWKLRILEWNGGKIDLDQKIENVRKRVECILFVEGIYVFCWWVVVVWCVFGTDWQFVFYRLSSCGYV